MAIVYRCSSKEDADAVALVLSSVGVPCRLERDGSDWLLLVEDARYIEATQAIGAHLMETSERHSRGEPPRRSGKWSFSAAMVALALLILHGILALNGQAEAEVARFGSDAAAIVHGEVYRCITALFFHADVVHVVSNSIGITLFGTAVVRETGYGLGWLLVLLSGSLGNLANAHVYHAHHLSIGASTAVFGAIGVLVAFGLVRKRNTTGRLRSVLIPLGGGLALLGILGSGGERTDLLAHLFGFMAGGTLAAPFAVANKKLAAPLWERLFFALACMVVVFAWLRLIRV